MENVRLLVIRSVRNFRAPPVRRIPERIFSINFQNRKSSIKIKIKLQKKNALTLKQLLVLFGCRLCAGSVQPTAAAQSAVIFFCRLSFDRFYCLYCYRLLFFFFTRRHFCAHRVFSSLRSRFEIQQIERRLNWCIMRCTYDTPPTRLLRPASGLV